MDSCVDVVRMVRGDIAPRSRALMHRMAKQNIERAEAPKEVDLPSEAKYLVKAVRMLVLIAALDSYMIDLETALVDANLMRQRVKRDFNRAYSKIVATHNAVYRDILNDVRCQKPQSRQFVNLMDKLVANLDENVLLSDKLERSYSIVVGLCRLIGRYNEFLRGHYDYYRCDDLAILPDTLLNFGLNSSNLEIIIEKSFVD
jgi:hypothetical protein